MTECEDCGRPLRRPSPDGLGPVCRRKKRPEATEPSRTTAGHRQLLDHAALADAGQLAIPVQPTLDACELTWRRRRKRHITTIPGPDTWEDR
ncbi:hypothetical protein [Streptomyces sioyaensis]|uniref:hypothetical protein n=1 Tax=Streptomyces sioyaensis TaxID=67364 RepID=UPI003D74458A